MLALFFFAYLGVASFGILNLVIGIISERTFSSSIELKEASDFAYKRSQMRAIIRLANHLFADPTDEGLSRRHFELAALKTPQVMEAFRSVELPRSFELQDLHLVFDEDQNGTVNKDELVKGMFRLIFNNDFQRHCCIELAIAQVKGILVDGFKQLTAELTSLRLSQDAVLHMHGSGAKHECVTGPFGTVDTAKAASTSAKLGDWPPQDSLSDDIAGVGSRDQ